MTKEQKHAWAIGGLGLAAIIAVFYILASKNTQVPIAQDDSVLPAVPAAVPLTPSYINYNVTPYNPNPLAVQGYTPQGAGDGCGCCPGCAGDTGVMNNSVNNYYAIGGSGIQQGVQPVIG